VFCLRDVYLDGKHMIRSSLDLVAIAIDVSTGTGSDLQDQLQDSNRNQKMPHTGMLVQSHQHIAADSIMLMGYRTNTG
jgi:hypothetical protein